MPSDFSPRASRVASFALGGTVVVLLACGGTVHESGPSPRGATSVTVSASATPVVPANETNVTAGKVATLTEGCVVEHGSKGIFQTVHRELRDERGRVLRLVRTWAHGDYIEDFTYDDRDRILTHRTSDGIAACYAYGDHKVVISGCDDPSSAQTHSIDDAGHILDATGGSGYPTTFEYDAGGILAATRWRSGEERWTQTWSYDDAAGLLGSVEDVVTPTQTARCEEHWRYLPSAASITVAVDETSPWGTPPSECTYGFDPLGRLTWVHCASSPACAHDSFEYDGEGRVLETISSAECKPGSPAPEQWRLTAACAWPPTRAQLAHSFAIDETPTVTYGTWASHDWVRPRLQRPYARCFESWGDE